MCESQKCTVHRLFSTLNIPFSCVLRHFRLFISTGFRCVRNLIARIIVKIIGIIKVCSLATNDFVTTNTVLVSRKRVERNERTFPVDSSIHTECDVRSFNSKWPNMRRESAQRVHARGAHGATRYNEELHGRWTRKRNRVFNFLHSQCTGCAAQSVCACIEGTTAARCHHRTTLYLRWTHNAIVAMNRWCDEHVCIVVLLCTQIIFAVWFIMIAMSLS